MTIDAYSSCPCGSGKKFKWCCQPIHVAINRAFEQEASGQHELALRLMDEIVAQNPTNPEAWGRKAQLLYQNNRAEEAENALQKAFDLNPNYAAGYYLRGMFRFNEGELTGALLLFRKAAESYDPQALDLLADVYSLIVNCELKMNRPIAARAAIQIAMHCEPANTELREGFDNIFGDKARLPESARKEYRFMPPAEGADGARRTAWNAAITGATTGRPADAGRAFDALTQADANDAPAWYNLAISKAWIGDNAGAVQAIERYVALEGDEGRASDAWTLAEVLRCGAGMADLSDYVEYSAVYQVRDRRPIFGLIQEWHKDGRFVVIQADEQGTSITALVLEAPSGLIATGADVLQARRLGCYLVLAGDFMRLACGNKEWLAGIQREVREKAGPSLTEPHEHIGPPIFNDVTVAALLFPVGAADPEKAEQLVREHAAKYYEETWIHQPLRSLSGTPPIDSAGHGTLRKKLLGVIRFVEECAAGGALHGYDFNRLRRKLGLIASAPDAAAAENGSVGDISAMNAAELSALAPEALSDQQLELAFQTAQKLDAHELAERFVRSLIARPPSPERTDRFPWYSYMVQRALVEGRMDDALDHVNEGERVDCEVNAGQRRDDYELRRAQVHAKRGEAESAGDVFQRLIERVPTNLRYHGSAAEAMLALKQPSRALRFAEEGLAKARQQNDRDSEGYLMELVAAAKKQNG